MLDNHRSRGDWCCDTAHGDGLWYTEQYPEEVVARALAAADGALPVAARRRRHGSAQRAARPARRRCARRHALDCNDPTDELRVRVVALGLEHGHGSRLGERRRTRRQRDPRHQPRLLIIVEGPDWAVGSARAFAPSSSPCPTGSSTRCTSTRFDYDGDCPRWKASVEERGGYVVEPGPPYTAPLWLGEFGIHHAQHRRTPGGRACSSTSPKRISTGRTGRSTARRAPATTGPTVGKRATAFST